jgi:hypothetical protein
MSWRTEYNEFVNRLSADDWQTLKEDDRFMDLIACEQWKDSLIHAQQKLMLFD